MAANKMFWVEDVSIPHGLEIILDDVLYVSHFCKIFEVIPA